jgi:hypothetical protein
MGLVSPGLEYWEAQSSSMDEAKIKKAQHDALQSQMNG